MEKFCPVPDTVERNKMVDKDDSTCFALPVGSCNACFNDYKIKIPFDLTSVALGGNIRKIGIKVEDISCSKLELYAGTSLEKDRTLYQVCNVDDIGAGWCEVLCRNGLANKNRIIITVQEMNLLPNTAKLCEVVFL